MKSGLSDNTVNPIRKINITKIAMQQTVYVAVTAWRWLTFYMLPAIEVYEYLLCNVEPSQS